MNCTIYKVKPLLLEKQSVGIDYFPQCRGIWLDTDELEKKIKRTYDSGFLDNRGYIADSLLYDTQDDNYYRDGHRSKKDSIDFFDCALIT